MKMLTTIWLGLAMALIAVINVSLMAWLWRFPMQPDPTGRDPNGVSSAPRFWVNVHRALGYVFLLIYLALLFEMVPRAWEFREQTGASIWHGVFGGLIGVILAIKISVIRRFKQFGHRLPWIGVSLALSTLAAVALSVPPAWRVMQPLAPLTPHLKQGRAVVAQKCVQCHGASLIANENEDAEEWDEITREMQKYSERIPDKTPITERERILATQYLIHTLAEADVRDEVEGETERKEDDDERRGRNRRRRGRDR